MAPAAQQGGSILTRKLGPLPGWAWVAIAVVGIYLYRKMTNTAATGSSTVPTAAVAAAPTESVTLPSGASYSGPAGVDLSGLLNAPPAGTANAPTGTVSAPTETITLPNGASYSGPSGGPDVGILAASGPAPGTAAPAPGNGGGTPGQTAAPTAAFAYPTADIGGQSYVDLGTITGAGGQYFGGNVAGGAPVYFGGPSGVSQLAGPAAIAAQPVGTEVYTPTQYQGLVSAAPVSEKL
jgi:hypothetical protein